MAGVATEETETGSSFEGVSSGQQQSQCQVGEALAECRSSEQVENGSPSTSPPFWDIDDDDDDGGLKPADLYGKYTWKIEKFSQINKRELRSDVFEIGGYKWYILIYPQGCDVCNHLSLFLCVANHDKLLPGWSHFAQFTIAVVNKDPKRSKYSDTLHRFWKKEHDWGWKKFMEQSKVKEGFIDGDNLTIRAQVQVIRERPDRPFRCLDCQYRGELVRVYLSNVEQICRRFVEERRAKLGKLLEDKPRWSSFCAFWLGMDQSTRHHMSREKSESILRVVVKHFFMEKEVTSTLVMDSLYSGLKALESHNNVNKSRGRYLETEDLPVPIVGIETDTFFLVDDVLLLLERAAMEPLPPKDEKGPQNRTKDGAAGEEPHKDTTDRDERRLTELGRRTIEIFVLAHIFSKIEVAYQEAVALKKQEELIREEEAAWLAEIEQKSRRGVDKEKKSKKKQGKQKKNNRKAKDKVKDDKTRCTVQDKIEQDSTTAERKEKAAEPEVVLEKPEIVEDASDASNSMDCVPEILVLDSDDRDVSPVNWDTDTSEVHPPMEASGNVTSGLSGVQNGTEGRFLSAVDDSCSTCSSDSVHSVRSVPQKGNSCYDKNKKSPSRGRNHKSKISSGSYDWVNGEPKQPFEALQDARITNDSSRSSNVVDHPSPTAGQQEKGEETSSLHKVILIKETVDVQEHGDGGARVNSSPKSPSNGTRLVTPPKLEMKNNAPVGPALVKKPSSNHPKQAVNSVLPTNSSENAATLKPVPQKLVTLIPAGYQKHIGTEKIAAQKVIEPTPLKFAASQPAEKSSGHQKPLGSEKLSSTEVPITSDKPSVPHIPVLSRPFSAPLVAGPRPAVSVVSRGQTAPVLARSVSAAGRLGPETTTAYGTQSYVPQSYRNAMMGGPVAGSSTSYSQNHSTTTSSVLNSSHSYPQVPAGVSAPIFTPQFSDRMKPSVSFRMSSHDDNMLQNGTVWIDCGERDGNHNAMVSEMQNVDLNASTRSKSPGCTTGRHNHGYPDEFPHLDIINYLFDDEHGVGMVDGVCQTSSSGPPHITRQYGEPSATGGMYSFQDDGYGGSHRDMIYTNGGQVDDFSMHNHWPPMLNVMRNMDAHAYPPPYHLSDYSNQMNGYTIFRPSNGL